MRSVVPLWVVVAVLAGCLAGPAPADEEDEGPGPAPSDDGASVLGRLFLHTDGERHWMDDAPGADADLLVVVPPTASSASYTFPLDPPLGMDVATAGVAVVQLSTTNGGIDVQDASLDAASGGTTNGEVDARLGTPGASGRHDWTSTNGDIHVTLDTAGIGIDAEGRTTNGDVTFDFAGTEDVGTQSRQHRHVRSADYASRDVQTVIVLGTTNGAIDAGDA